MMVNRLEGNLNTFDRLKKRVGLDETPGIHGATLTDFKIPLDQLPKKPRNDCKSSIVLDTRKNCKYDRR